MYIILTALVIFLAYLTIKKKKVSESLDIDLLNKRILEYEPESLIDPDITLSLQDKVIELHAPDESNRNCLNLAKVNYLDFLNNDYIKRKAEECIHRYGVGSCGPRVFFGTMDVHLDTESRIAEFMGTEDCMLYSYGFSTISSAVAAYCRETDIVFSDEYISFAAQQGLLESRSTVVYFRHNDVDDFGDKLKLLEEQERKQNKLYRKFLLVEGINGKTGKICPLPLLLSLQQKYKLRVILDESLSFGILGKTGRGITEHFDIDRSNIDVIMGNLECSLGFIGGFSVGTTAAMEFQRMCGRAYGFSASHPPFLCRIIICAIDLFRENPEMFDKLKGLSIKMDDMLKAISEINVLSDPISPKKVIQLKYNVASVATLHKLCSEQNIHTIKSEDTLSINLNINFSEQQLRRITNILSNACKALA